MSCAHPSDCPYRTTAYDVEALALEASPPLRPLLVAPGMASIRKQVWQRPVLSHFKSAPNPAQRFFSIWNFINSFRNASESNHEDLYRYSKGRWLWNEEPRLQERYKRFNISGLKQLAANVAGKQSCVGITKIDEGASNKTFDLSMDDGSVVIARVPHPKIDPPFRIISSEAATMEFVSQAQHKCELT